ncbi:MAG: AAA family ATPase, partial [Nocardioides sp.]|nr:AAA family ATPase [Nocardioides sp.]
MIVAVETTAADLVAISGSDPELDVVLIHEDLSPNTAAETLRDIALRHPHLAIILMVDEASPEVFAQAMESGARGVLTRDASVEELQARIAAGAEWARSVRERMEPSIGGAPTGGVRGTVVALAGAKGGTGTTLMTIQLAMAAIAAGRTVCLVDLDLQTGDIPSYLDMTHRRGITDLVDVADDINATVLADTLYVHPAGPHILLAPADGERGEDVNARLVRQVVGGLRTRYDVLLIDCGSYMTDASAMAVEIADTVLLTTTPDLPSLRAGKRLLKMWGRLQVRK